MDSSKLKHTLSFKSKFLAIGIPNTRSVCPFTVDYVIEFKTDDFVVSYFGHFYFSAK